jgi:hypothetical protein
MLDIQHEQIDHGLITLKATSRCAACGKAFRVQLPVAAITNAPKYPVCHLILHGNPIHAFVVYIDANGVVRGNEASDSIQIDRTSATFQELVRWWTAHADDDMEVD